jgi:hypothetical protein
MRFFLKISPPLLFLLLLAPVFLSISLSNMNWLMLAPLLNFSFFALFLGWIFSVGDQLGKRLHIQSSYKMLFRICITITLLCCLIASFYQLIENTVDYDFGHTLFNVLTIFVLLAVFYCFYFVSKVLVSLEINRNISFTEHRLEFFLFFFFFVGVWLLQPRIRKMVNSKD